MLQIPSLPAYQFPQPNYNAVKIDIHNPSVGGPATCPIQQPMMMPQAQPAQPQMPLYNYPMAPVYNYPQAVAQQPYYLPQPQMQSDVVEQAKAQAQAQAAAQAYQCPVCPPCPEPVQQAAPVSAPIQTTAAVAAPIAVPAQQINVNEAPKAPQPVVTVAPAPAASAAPAVEVQAPVQEAQQVDLNGFLARLTNPDYEVQANTMEEIANMVKDEPQKATELLDAKVMDSLINIMNADSSKLAGPTQEQIAARQKLMAGQEISENDKKLATTITPMEQAERNKSYAMYTSAILQKLYKDEVAKLTGSVVPLTELPAAMTIVDQLKDNPNPMVRASAIEALSYIQAPEYKTDLNTLFSIAKNDQDKGVQEAASAALAKLAQI